MRNFRFKKGFNAGKDYDFYKRLWSSIGEQGSLRQKNDSYDIIIDLKANYYVVIEKVLNSSKISVSLCYFYNYGYKNINIADIKDIVIEVAYGISKVKKILKYYKHLVDTFIKNGMNNRDNMLKVQKKDMKLCEERCKYEF